MEPSCLTGFKLQFRNSGWMIYKEVFLFSALPALRYSAIPANKLSSRIYGVRTFVGFSHGQGRENEEEELFGILVELADDDYDDENGSGDEGTALFERATKFAESISRARRKVTRRGYAEFINCISGGVGARQYALCVRRAAEIVLRRCGVGPGCAV